MLINLRNALMAGKHLPYDAEVEFLESTGTQYIDTGVIGGSSSKVEISASSSNTAQNMGLFGSRNVSFVKAFTIWQRVTNTSVRFDFTDDTSNRVIANAAWDTSGVNTVVKDGPNNTLNGVAGENNSTATFTCEYPFYLFSINTSGTATSNASARVYSCKIWQNGVLVRDYIPVRKGAVGYLYDRVSGKLFGNAGTGDFVLGPDVVPVEWLESGANTYINTGIIPNDTYGMEVTGYTTQTNDSAWIGTRSSTTQRCYMGYAPSLGFYYGWNGRQDVQYTKGVWSTVSMNLYNSRKNVMDGVQVGSITETLSTQNRAIYVFGLIGNGTVGLKIKNALITKGSDDVQKLLSVRVGTEGAMMDVLTRRIYRNAGTGAFTYGNDLRYPIPAE